MLDLVLATRNPGKVREMRALLHDLPVRLHSVADFPDAPDVEEDAPTLEGNARKKAAALHAHTGLPTLADDTGLEVSALGGRPGVHSARFAGPQADDAANRARLRRLMQDQPDRTARFRTVLAFIDGKETQLFEGLCTGRLLTEERGHGGFGYDPLFVPDGETRTFAELSQEEKNRLSHRGHALRAFVAYLRRRLSASPSP
ncbi:MAG: RdgB/HAM1 family non-canonical purine NTP pyrophosphatase [Bacteroidetes bacterium]|nr:MAG: RdgB/HAM1 family non-canonical purine NTP pyrophosphatase [Bacteroidota bacterium]